MAKKNKEDSKLNLKLDPKESEQKVSDALQMLRQSKKKNNKSKTNFMQELLKSKLLESIHKEKLIHLVSEEIKKFENDHNSVKKDVTLIKKQLRKISDNIGECNDDKMLALPKSDGGKKNKHHLDIKSHKPKEFADFMQLFEERDGFKYLTHDFDKTEPFNIEEYLDKAEKLFTLETKKKSIPSEIWRVTQRFAFEKNLGEKDEEGNLIYWTDADGKTITIGWSSPSVKAWSIKHQSSPFGFENFENKIHSFRNLTRIKSSSNNLYEILKGLVDEILPESKWNITIDSGLKRLDYYCHVTTVKKAFEFLLKEIKEFSQHESINILSNNEGEGKYRISQIIIEHLGSYPGIDISNITANWVNKLGKGGMGSIRYNLYRQANWSIITKAYNEVGNEVPVKVNMLHHDSAPNIEHLDSDEEVNGFKHIITFFYKA